MISHYLEFFFAGDQFSFILGDPIKGGNKVDDIISQIRCQTLLALPHILSLDLLENLLKF